MKENVIIDFNKVTKMYGGKPGLIEGTFGIQQGQITAFVGKNGAGKTTTIKLIMGFLVPDKGQILIKGKPLPRNPNNDDIGYLPEIVKFPGLYTPKKLFRVLAGMRRVPGPGYLDNINKMAEILDIKGSLNSRLGTFSKGMLQKVAILQAFIHNPNIVILDEPTSGLDPIARNNLFYILKEQQKQGKTIIVSSHNLDELEPLADFYVFFDNSFVLKAISKAEIDRLSKTCIKIKELDSLQLEKLRASLGGKNLVIENDRILLERQVPINHLLSCLSQNNVEIISVEQSGATVKDYYFQLINQEDRLASLS